MKHHIAAMLFGFGVVLAVTVGGRLGSAGLDLLAIVFAVFVVSVTTLLLVLHNNGGQR